MLKRHQDDKHSPDAVFSIKHAKGTVHLPHVIPIASGAKRLSFVPGRDSVSRRGIGTRVALGIAPQASHRSRGRVRTVGHRQTKGPGNLLCLTPHNRVTSRLYPGIFASA